MGKIIAVCNQKGGVGKTTTAVNLASAIALKGISTLLVDLDPQANATGGLGIDKKQITHSIYQILLEDLSIDSVIRSTQVPNLSLLPAQVALSGAEIELSSFQGREKRLKSALASIRERYSLILIDAPPSLGLLTINALTAADSVLIPLQCEYYALEGLSQLLETVRLVQEVLNPSLEVEGVLLTMADFRTKLTSDVIEEVRNFFGSKVYETIVPRSIRLSEAPSYGLPIALYDPESIGAKAYQALADQLFQSLEKERSDARDKRFRSGNPSPDPRETSGSTYPDAASSPAPAAGAAPARPGRAGGGGSGLDSDRADSAESLPAATEPR